MVVMDDHFLLSWHRVLLFLRKGRNGKAKRNEGCQGGGGRGIARRYCCVGFKLQHRKGSGEGVSGG